MDPYFTIILTQNALLCLVTSCFIYRSTTLENREKAGFYLTIYTGLRDRTAFSDDSHRCRRKIIGILMIDLDDFKSVNDTYGHLEGDKYLQVFARCQREVF